MKYSRSIKEKAEVLLRQLTLDEKIGMIHGAGLFRTAPVPRLGIPALKMSDGPMGVRQEMGDASWAPVCNTEDYVSYLPSNSAIAATWNRALAHKAGEVLGAEARGRGKDVILGPGINIKRSPLCGRNFEYMSEDPCLTAGQCVPLIQGVQQNDAAVCVKHFALNCQETERLWVDTEVSDAALYEIYLPAFRAAVKDGGALSVMGAYNLLRGEHCCQSKFLLNGILREEWGYEGTVISDWSGVHDTVLTAEAGLDIEMSVTDNFDEYFLARPLKKAVAAGKVKEELIDQKVRHILWMMFALHMIDLLPGETKAFRPARKAGGYNLPAHRQAIREIARESVVLLKNEGHLLPLPAGMKKLLVVGQNADRVYSCGGGSAEIKALYEISPLMGLHMLLGGNCEIRFAAGYETESAVQSGNWQETSLQSAAQRSGETGSESERARALREEAVRLAREYDHVLFVGGLDHTYDLEGQDRADMKLPYGQDLLIRELLRANPDTVVTFVGGSPVEMSAWEPDAKAIVWSWYAGMEGGTALAEVLLGQVNPSGKLPESFPYRHSDCGAHQVGDFGGKEMVHCTEGIYVGYRYYEKDGIAVQFPFGHGLSYTEFGYRDLSAEVDESGFGLQVLLQFTVSNIGERAGAETVQIYVADRTGRERPVKELRGYDKVFLQPGESKQVRIALHADAFAAYDEKEGCMAVEPGEYELLVGSSSQDIRLLEIIRLEKEYRENTGKK